MRGRRSIDDAAASGQESVTAVQLDCVHGEVADVLLSGELSAGVKLQAKAWPAGMKLDILNHFRASVCAHQNIACAQQGAIAIRAIEHAVRNAGAAACSSTSAAAGSTTAGRRCNLPKI